MQRRRAEQREPAAIEAIAVVNVQADQARRWFLELETHPERYQLETHGGFAFTQGSFGEVGARFQTQERFFGLRLSLLFELTEITDTHFEFRLIRPALPIWATFVIKEASVGTVHVHLRIGGTARRGTRLLRIPLVRGAIGRQIRSEVTHIKESMEALYGISAGKNSDTR